VQAAELSFARSAKSPSHLTLSGVPPSSSKLSWW
jgi:hypothetical protein